jgi:hypothetical protein
LINALESKEILNIGIPLFKSIEVTKGRYGGSWIHPDLGIYHGSSITIPMRKDGMINATMLCKAHGKKLLTNYTRNKETKDYLDELSSDMRISITQLIQICKGNSSKFQQGTWVHRKVAIHLAQWISPSFALQVSRF